MDFPEEKPGNLLRWSILYAKIEVRMVSSRNHTDFSVEFYCYGLYPVARNGTAAAWTSYFNQSVQTSCGPSCSGGYLRCILKEEQ